MILTRRAIPIYYNSEENNDGQRKGIDYAAEANLDIHTALLDWRHRFLRFKSGWLNTIIMVLMPNVANASITWGKVEIVGVSFELLLSTLDFITISVFGKIF